MHSLNTDSSTQSKACPSRAVAVVVIPAFNEGRSIGAVVRQVIDLTGLPVVVVDDFSSDDTAKNARGSGAGVIRLHIRHGAWGAVQTGMRYARQRGYDYVVTMDADGQHDAASIDKLIDCITSSPANVVIGLCLERGSYLRHLAWSALRRLSRLDIEDLTSGFRAYDRSAIEVLVSRSATLLTYQDIGVLILLRNHDKQIVEIKVPMYQRKTGISRIYYSWRAVLSYLTQTCLLCVSKFSLGSNLADKPEPESAE